MAVTILESYVTPIGEWFLKFQSDQTAPVTFYVYVDGLLADTIKSSSAVATYMVWVADGDAAALEILDKPCLPNHAFPPRFTLNWLKVSSAFEYRVDRYVSGVWVEQDRIREDGQNSYTYVTEKLEDETQHQFRIVPVDANDIDGSALSFTKLMVRHPDVPTLSVIVSSNHLIVSS